MKTRRLTTTLLALTTLSWSAPALAVDGVIEINQVRALAGGVSGGVIIMDQPGFPVSIFNPGSYRLTSNLEVPSENTTAIEVNVADVTIDLNGFVIQNATPCRPDCAPNGTGIGIDGNASENVTVHDGTILGMGAEGILLGADARVVGVRAISNGADGIVVGNTGVVRESTVSGNLARGIDAALDSLVIDNVVRNSGTHGIVAQAGSSVRGNAVDGMGATGISVGASSMVSANTVQNTVSHGISAGLNTIVADNIVRSAGVGADGISVGESSLVRGNASRDNGRHGIAVTDAGAVLANVIHGNGQHGVDGSNNLSVADNVAVGNGAAGVFVNGTALVARNSVHDNTAGLDALGFGSVFTDNSVTGSSGVGLLCGTNAGYGGNVFSDNNSGGAQTSCTNQIDANVCGSNTTCP